MEPYSLALLEGKRTRYIRDRLGRFAPTSGSLAGRAGVVDVGKTIKTPKGALDGVVGAAHGRSTAKTAFALGALGTVGGSAAWHANAHAAFYPNLVRGVKLTRRARAAKSKTLQKAGMGFVKKGGEHLAIAAGLGVVAAGSAVLAKKVYAERDKSGGGKKPGNALSAIARGAGSGAKYGAIAGLGGTLAVMPANAAYMSYHGSSKKLAIGAAAANAAMGALYRPTPREGKLTSAPFLVTAGAAGGSVLGAARGYRNYRKNRVKESDMELEPHSLALLEGKKKGGWSESKHPRDKEGRFTVSGALGGATRVAGAALAGGATGAFAGLMSGGSDSMVRNSALGAAVAGAGAQGFKEGKSLMAAGRHHRREAQKRTLDVYKGRQSRLAQRKSIAGAALVGAGGVTAGLGALHAAGLTPRVLGMATNARGKSSEMYQNYQRVRRLKKLFKESDARPYDIDLLEGKRTKYARDKLGRFASTGATAARNFSKNHKTATHLAKVGAVALAAEVGHRVGGKVGGRVGGAAMADMARRNYIGLGKNREAAIAVERYGGQVLGRMVGAQVGTIAGKTISSNRLAGVKSISPRATPGQKAAHEQRQKEAARLYLQGTALRFGARSARAMAGSPVPRELGRLSKNSAKKAYNSRFPKRVAKTHRLGWPSPTIDLGKNAYRVKESDMQPYSLVLLEKGGWSEAKHPRDKGGKFTSVGPAGYKGRRGHVGVGTVAGTAYGVAAGALIGGATAGPVGALAGGVVAGAASGGLGNISDRLTARALRKSLANRRALYKTKYVSRGSNVENSERALDRPQGRYRTKTLAGEYKMGQYTLQFDAKRNEEDFARTMKLYGAGYQPHEMAVGGVRKKKRVRESFAPYTLALLENAKMGYPGQGIPPAAATTKKSATAKAPATAKSGLKRKKMARVATAVAA